MCRYLFTYAVTCAEPAYSYFREKFYNDLKPVVDAFKVACYFSDLDSLTVIPIVTVAEIQSLKSELPSYLAKAKDLSPEIDLTDWWKKYASDLP